MSRDAVVVGINTYEAVPPWRAPAVDAQAVAQLLEKYGDFQVKRFPEIIQDEPLRVGKKTKVSLTELEEALVQLFLPEGKSIPDTALFYFSGHGLRKNVGIQEGYLATSAPNPSVGNWGIHLNWLRKLLEKSPVLKIISLSLVIPISIAALVGWVIYRELSIRPHWQTLYRTQGVVDSPERQQALLQLNRLRASMRKAPLQGASLDKIKLEEANLWDANLSFANLKGARLRSANLEGANLEGANLYDAHLSDANLNSANLRKANLNRADLIRANLNRAHLNRAHLHSAQLSDADLIFADLRKADLKGAQLSDADLIFANLKGANLNRANLIKAKKLTPSQIKSACNWEKAIYKGSWDDKQEKWVIDEEANQQYIDRLFKDKASDPYKPVDCHWWE